MKTATHQDALSPSQDYCVYIIDGGSLFHQIPLYNANMPTHTSNCERYADYVTNSRFECF